MCQKNGKNHQVTTKFKTMNNIYLLFYIMHANKTLAMFNSIVYIVVHFNKGIVFVFVIA